MEIAICEDLVEDSNLLRRILQQVAESFKEPLAIECMSSGEALIERLERGKRYDLIVLDIYMEGLNGIEAARSIRKIDAGTELAFLTSSEDFAIQAFDLNALHYLVKPITEEKARVLFNRLYRKKAGTSRFLELEAGREFRRFPLSKIKGILSKDKGTIVQLTDAGERWINCPFWQAEEKLSAEINFVLISRGYILNLDQVSCIDYDVCRMLDGTEMQISRRERSRVKSKYNDYLFYKLDQSKGG